MKLKRIIQIVLIAAAAQFAYGESSVHLRLPEQLSRGALPHFAARDRDGANVVQRRQLERMVTPGTKRVALVYFATWCVPCAQGAVKLKDAKTELERNGILPIYVNIGEGDVEAVNGWVRRYGGPDYTLIMDTRGQMTRNFGLMEQDGRTMITPQTLILDEKLKPLFLLGSEGDDFPEILWRYEP